MPDPRDLAETPVGPVDASGEPDRQDDLPPAPAGLTEDERGQDDPDDLPAGEPEDNPDDLSV